MSVFTVPLSGANESFFITLGQNYGFTVIWRDDPCGMGGWFLDISDAHGDPLVQGIPLVTGADLWAQYAYLGFTGQLWMQNLVGASPTEPPTFDNLGTDCQMFWGSP